MLRQSRPLVWLGMAASIAMMAVMTAPASAQEMVLKKGTKITLEFDTPLHSKTTRIGDKIHFHVKDPVLLDGKTVISAGEKTTGTVEKVQKPGRYGINGKVRLAMGNLATTTGQTVPLGFKTEGPVISGKTGGAAAATAGGALVLGPVGLIGGVFITGKTVDAKPGDVMTVTVDRDIPVNAK